MSAVAHDGGGDLTLEERLHGADLRTMEADLDADGVALLPALLTKHECEQITAMYRSEEKFRSRVVMARHNFGRGEYKYFDYPLPPLVQTFRSAFYPQLARVANRWHEALGFDERFPEDHATFLARCHAAGQARPTALLLAYGAGDFNCLHQDLYGDHVFPLQVALLLSEPGRDFTGGEFVITEQRPRAQSRPMVVPLRQGDAAVFAVRHRPVAGTRGYHRVALRHGVSRVRTGARHTLGIIFHDAL